MREWAPLLGDLPPREKQDMAAKVLRAGNFLLCSRSTAYAPVLDPDLLFLVSVRQKRITHLKFKKTKQNRISTNLRCSCEAYTTHASDSTIGEAELRRSIFLNLSDLRSVLFLPPQLSALP